MALGGDRVIPDTAGTAPAFPADHPAGAQAEGAMANPKNKGMTVREAAEEFCTQWAWSMAVSGDPGDAESQLTKMLGHKVDPPDSRRARWRARANTPQPTGDEIRAVAVKVMRKAEKKGVLDRNVQRDRETAVFMAIKNIPSDPDQFDRRAPRRLWATGRKVPVDPSKRREPIPTDMWEFLDLDIEGERAAGEGLEYCGLRIYDADPAQAVSGDAQDAVATVDATKAQLQQAAEPPEPGEAEHRPLDKHQRNRDVEAEALLKNRIKAVIAKAKARWPDPQKRPGVNQMARLLVKGQPKSKVEKFGQDAIRKILAGTYKPARDISIPGLSSG